MNARRMLVLLALVPLSAVLAGCPDDGDSTGDPSVDNARRVAQAACAKQTECCPGNESESECIDGLMLALGTAAALDGIEVVDDAADRCVAAYAATPCETASAYGGFPTTLTLCPDLLAAGLANGERCGGSDLLSSVFGDDQCLSGYCNGAGVCADPATSEGAACDGDAGCGDGLDCYRSACVAVAGMGEDCSQRGLCADGLKCIDETCQIPRQIAVGEVCTADGVCELGDDLCLCPPDDETPCDAICGDAGRCLP